MEEITKYYKTKHFSRTEVQCCGAKVEHTGFMLMSSPPKYEFICPKCNSSCYLEADKVAGNWGLTYTHSTSAPANVNKL